jgi:hypothetical protein
MVYDDDCFGLRHVQKLDADLPCATAEDLYDRIKRQDETILALKRQNIALIQRLQREQLERPEIVA